MAPESGSSDIAYDEPFKHIFDVAVRYPWHPNAYFFGLVNTADLSRESLSAGKTPFIGVVPMHTGNWRGSVDPMDGASIPTRPAMCASTGGCATARIRAACCTPANTIRSFR